MSGAPPSAPPPARQPALPLRLLLVVGGTLALGLGVLGAFLPLLPTTPLVLLAAGCYARALPPAHRWLRANRFFGPMLRSGREGRYLPRPAKAGAVTFTLASFCATIVFAVEGWPLRALLAGIALGVTAWLLSLPTRPQAAARRARD